MRKSIAYGYLVLTIMILVVMADVIATRDACQGFDKIIQEGDSYSGTCGSDGVGVVGVLFFSLLATLAYLLISKFVLRWLGYKLTKIGSDK